MSLQIKPLVWEPIDVGECLEGTGDYYICHQAGRYWIHRKASGDLRGADGSVAFYEDRDDAKAAAQLDYETRIRSALLPSIDTEARIKGTISEDVERSIKMAEAYAMSNSDNYLIAYLASIRDAIEAAARPEARIGELEGALEGALREIATERQRQISKEGWTPEHDDKHTGYEMSQAAGVYALVAGSEDYRWIVQGLPGNDYIAAAQRLWPWDKSWFKPTDRRRDLIKAAALIVAEIDRLDRAALRPLLPETGEKG